MFTATVNGTLSRLGLDPRGNAPFPRSTAPMLMHKADRLVSSPDWTYEPKWDGFRMIATVRDGSVHLFSRNGRSFTIPKMALSAGFRSSVSLLSAAPSYEGPGLSHGGTNSH